MSQSGNFCKTSEYIINKIVIFLYFFDNFKIEHNITKKKKKMNR